VLLQFAIHIVSLLYISHLSEKTDPYVVERLTVVEFGTLHLTRFSRRSERVDLEAEFKPGLLNSAIYLISLSQQVSTFAVNYQVCVISSLTGKVFSRVDVNCRLI
jgi:cation-transporting ATPase 13A1